jgi:hypothetical protein
MAYLDKINSKDYLSNTGLSYTSTFSKITKNVVNLTLSRWVNAGMPLSKSASRYGLG